MEFEEACSEMNYILEHLEPKDLIKIPKSVQKFFKENKSIFYKVDLDVTKDLKEQELKEETKVFIKILNDKYLHYTSGLTEMTTIIDKQEENIIANKNEIAIYKERKIARLFKKIISFFKKNR